MRVPSRRIPSYEEVIPPSHRYFLYLLLGVIIVWIGYAIWQEPASGLFLVAMIAVTWIVSIPTERAWEKKIAAIREERKGEDIGTFARALPFRKINTWIIRALYEEIADEMGDDTFPLRPSDRLEEDLRLDDDALFWIYERVMRRVGLSVEGVESNPYYDRVKTVEDMVMFFHHQEGNHKGYPYG